MGEEGAGPVSLNLEYGGWMGRLIDGKVQLEGWKVNWVWVNWVYRAIGVAIAIAIAIAYA
ncbi:hypothetical protein PTI98_008706 [Pleurotus ostreatus]|nr:hypothetical protein PTI98_008706 [Pleurotus ostreatus]